MDDTPITTHTLWMLLKEAPDVPGTWVAICPRLGMISCGNNPTHACAMGLESIEMLWTHDIRAGKNPFNREDPLDPHSAEISALLADHQLIVGPVGPALANRRQFSAIIVKIEVGAGSMLVSTASA